MDDGRILSQDEVDALLNGISDGDVETDAEEDAEETEEGVEREPEEAPYEVEDKDSGEVRAYDLTSQDKIIRGRMPTLEIINDRYARLTRASFSGALRKVVDVTVSQREDMVRFGDFSRTLTVPTSIHILKMDPYRGHVLLVVESFLIFNLLDCFFGGSGIRWFKIEGREFTSIEQRVINKVVQMMLKDLREAWKPVEEINLQFIRSEMNPRFASIVPLTEPVLVVNFELEMEKPIGKIVLCMPYSTIEPIRSKLAAGYQSDQLEADLRWIERLKDRLMEIEVELTVELGRSEIKGKDLLHLSTGDTIVLDQDVDDPLLVKVQGIPKFRASTGKLKGNHALRIAEIIPPGTEVSR